MNDANLGATLLDILERVRPLLQSLGSDHYLKKPAPEKWSPIEVMGHLVDSASNNHQRFVRASFQDNLVFSGYQQDKWVSLQQYQHSDWSSIIDLWYYFNKHIADLMDAIPQEITKKEHTDHNLHEIAWKTVPKTTPTTLEYFMRDYIGHLEHHLKQVLQYYKE